MNKKIATALLCFVLLVQTVSACSCAGPITPESSYENSDTVFYGKIISIENVRESEWLVLLKTDFEIIESFKGNSPEIISIYSEENNGANCGYTFGLDESSYGREFLVFAYVGDGKLMTSSCSGTTSTEFAGDELNVLREIAGMPLIDSPVEPEPMPSEPGDPIAPETEKKNALQRIWLWFSNLF